MKAGYRLTFQEVRLKMKIKKLKNLKFSISMLFVLMLVNSCKTSKLFNNTSEFQFHGKVKYVLVQSHENIGDEENPILGNKLSSSKKYHFAPQGNIDSIEVYDSDSVSLRIIFETVGQKTLKEIMYSTSNNSIQRTSTYIYANNEEYDFTVHDAGGQVAEKGKKIIKDNLVIEESFTSYGVLKFVTNYKYDSENRLININRIRDKSTLIHDMSFVYFGVDENQNWIKRLVEHRNEVGDVTFTSFQTCTYEYYK